MYEQTKVVLDGVTLKQVCLNVRRKTSLLSKRKEIDKFACIKIFYLLASPVFYLKRLKLLARQSQIINGRKPFILFIRKKVIRKSHHLIFKI